MRQLVPRKTQQVAAGNFRNWLLSLAEGLAKSSKYFTFKEDSSWLEFTCTPKEKKPKNNKRVEPQSNDMNDDDDDDDDSSGKVNPLSPPPKPPKSTNKVAAVDEQTKLFQRVTTVESEFKSVISELEKKPNDVGYVLMKNMLNEMASKKASASTVSPAPPAGSEVPSAAQLELDVLKNGVCTALSSNTLLTKDLQDSILKVLKVRYVLKDMKADWEIFYKNFKLHLEVKL